MTGCTQWPQLGLQLVRQEPPPPELGYHLAVDSTQAGFVLLDYEVVPISLKSPGERSKDWVGGGALKVPRMWNSLICLLSTTGTGSVHPSYLVFITDLGSGRWGKGVS